jgi:MFS family permease
MTRWVKCLIFILLLMGAGYYFGTICTQISEVDQLLNTPAIDILYLLLWFLLSLTLMMICSGLVAALLRPLWVAAIAFVLSGFAMLLGWQISFASGVLVLVFAVVGVIYTNNIMQGFEKQADFSVRPIGQNQNILSLGLILVACGSLFLGFHDYIDREGFTIPDRYLEIMMEPMEKQILLRAPDEGGQEMVFQFREEFRNFMDEFLDETVKPYERYIPILVSGGLFFSLYTIANLLTWLPTLITHAILTLLTSIGIARFEIETREVRRLRMD